MKTIRFNRDRDLAPLPFEDRICRQALELKRLGLKWQPHVGCFVWDVGNAIQVDSPFPGNIYFILSLPRFIEIFGSIEDIIERLVWLPTWHQARILLERLEMSEKNMTHQFRPDVSSSPSDDLLRLYERLAEAIKKEK